MGKRGLARLPRSFDSSKLQHRSSDRSEAERQTRDVKRAGMTTGHLSSPTRRVSRQPDSPSSMAVVSSDLSVRACNVDPIVALRDYQRAALSRALDAGAQYVRQAA